LTTAIRFATIEDGNWFEKTVKRVTEEEFGERMGDLVANNRYFVDFMR
jgi:hypothetical protein